MPQNRASMVVSQQQQAAALAAIAQVNAQLNGLVSLEPDERRSMPKMGPKSDRFARGVVRLLQQNAAIVPAGMELQGAVADLDAIDKLLPILDALQKLTSRVDDTVSALGSDVMDVAQTGYGMLKILGNAHGLEDMRKDLGYRWAKSRRKESPTTK